MTREKDRDAMGGELVPTYAARELAQGVPKHRMSEEGMAPRVAYQWTQGGRPHQLSVRVDGSPYLPDETSEESFITEHYWGYVRQRNGTSLEYRVEHPR